MARGSQTGRRGRKPAKSAGKRDPVTHRTPAQQKKLAAKRSADPKWKAQNAKQKKIRREFEKDGKVSKGDGTHIDHKKPLASGGSNAKSNLRVTSASKNSGHGMANQHSKKRKAPNTGPRKKSSTRRRK